MDGPLQLHLLIPKLVLFDICKVKVTLLLQQLLLAFQFPNLQAGGYRFGLHVLLLFNFLDELVTLLINSSSLLPPALVFLNSTGYLLPTLLLDSIKFLLSFLLFLYGFALQLLQSLTLLLLSFLLLKTLICVELCHQLLRIIKGFSVLTNLLVFLEGIYRQSVTSLLRRLLQVVYLCFDTLELLLDTQFLLLDFR